MRPWLHDVQALCVVATVFVPREVILLEVGGATEDEEAAGSSLTECADVGSGGG